MLRALGDGTLFADAHGEGAPRVIWLHGWARRGADFARCGEMVAARGVASLALDLPGFGASPPPAEAGGARRYADVVASALGDLGEGFVLVGHSFGGRVATVIAAEHPELVRALVLTGAPVVRVGASRTPATGYRLIRALRRWRLVSEERLEAARQRYGSADYRAASGVVREVLVATLAEDYSDELARLVAPVELVWGERDREVPVAVATRVRDLLTARGVPVVTTVVPGVGHLLPLEAPDALAAAAMRALS